MRDQRRVCPEASGPSRRKGTEAIGPVSALLQGGSPLSPAAVISQGRAQQQAAALSNEIGCPTSSIQEMTSCLRQKPANILNDAQTKVGTRV